MVSELPFHNSLDIGPLSGCFNDTSASYKFYWFISIIEAIEKGFHTIDKQYLFASMVANAWYTTNYFHLSFGKSDIIQRAVKLIMEVEYITIDKKKDQILEKLVATHHSITIKSLKHFDKEVPHRFLGPWFKGRKGDRNAVYEFSQSFGNGCLYAIDKHRIVINPKWMNYLRENAGILKAFCFWHLSHFIQKHNPNVPDIVNKINKLPQRKSLNLQRTKFWNIVIEKNGPVECIYTRRLLKINDYAVEHFVPFAFVSHDLIWNLIPADKVINCSKSDKLPILKDHFEGYFNLQELAIRTILNSNPKNTFLQDYLTIIPELTSLNDLSKNSLREKFMNNINPLITIAANNGFEYMNTIKCE